MKRIIIISVITFSRFSYPITLFYKLIIISVIVITIILLIWGVYYMFFSDRPRKVDKISGIKIFHYSYSVGYHYEARIYYELECKNKCTLKIKDEGITEEDAPVPPDGRPAAVDAWGAQLYPLWQGV